MKRFQAFSFSFFLSILGMHIDTANALIVTEFCDYDAAWIPGAPAPTLSCEMGWEPGGGPFAQAGWGRHSGNAFFVPNPVISDTWNTGIFGLSPNIGFNVELIVCTTQSGAHEINGTATGYRGLINHATGVITGFIEVQSTSSYKTGDIVSNSPVC